MANYNNLKQGIQAVIKENHNNEITGQLLQQALLAMINSLGVGYQFIDVAKPSTNPGSPDQRVFYIAEGPGNYVNFNAEVFPGELAIFEYSTTWLKQSVQVSDLKNIGFVGTFQSGIALDPSDGEEITDTTYDASDYIPVEKGSVIIYSGGETDGNRAAIIGYDADKYMVNVLLAGGSDWLNKIVAISDPDIKYVRVSSCNSTHPDYGTPFAFNVVRTTELLVEIDGLKNDVASINATIDFFSPFIDLVREGYIFKGIATPSTELPENLPSDVFYYVEQPGVYAGGTLGQGQVGLLVSQSGGVDWSIEVLDIAKASSLATTNTNLSNLTMIVQNILSVVAAGYEFIGVATPSQVFPEDTYKHNVMYLVQTPGTYSNLGNFQIAADEVALLMWNAQSEEWSKQDLDLAKKSYSDATFETKSHAEDTYAKKVGFVPRLIAGGAQGIMNPVLANAMFLRRITGGAVSSVGSGPAMIGRLGGVSRVFNQNINPTGISYSAATSEESQGVVTVTPASTSNRVNYTGYNIIPNHYYLATVMVKCLTANSVYFANYLPDGNINTIVNIGASSQSGYAQAYTLFYCRATPSSSMVQFTAGNAGTFQYIKDSFNLIDLTQLFNGSVPEGHTVADFQRDYPLLYYAYTTGKVLPFAAQNLETTGVNQWDEEWDNGKISPSDGQNMEGTEVRSKNYIPVLPNTEYYFRSKSVAGAFNAFFYDENKVYFDFQTGVQRNGTFTTPNRAAYMRFYEGSSYGTTYNHDICINISDPAINGQYFPYQKNTLAVNPGAWQDTDGNLVYPGGGMQGLGAVQDFAEADADGYFRKATNVYGRVDMGNTDWNYNETYGYFYKNVGSRDVGKVVCDKYIAGTAATAQTMTDKTVQLFSSNIYIKDSSYTDAYTFKTAMSGVYAYVELATPVEKTLKTPVPAIYIENANGTEAWTPENTSDPYTSPCDMDVQYPLNVFGGIVTALNAMLTANSLTGSFSESNGNIIYTN